MEAAARLSRQRGGACSGPRLAEGETWCAAQPRDSLASRGSDACAPRCRGGGCGAGGDSCVSGTGLLVPSSTQLAQTVAHGIQWHPSSGQLERAPWNWPGVGSSGVGGAFCYAGLKGPALFQAALGAAASLPPCFEAWTWPRGPAVHPFSFPPVGWSSARFLFLDHSFLSRRLRTGGELWASTWFRKRFGDKSKAFAFVRAGNQCDWDDWKWKGPRGLGECGTNWVKLLGAW